jgi:protein gp37
MELFGEWVKPEWLEEIFSDIRQHPQHTFIFLSKQPQNLRKWSPFPDNCWVGVSVIGEIAFKKAVVYLQNIDAKIKFISFEPLLERISTTEDIYYFLKDTDINLIIIGQQTPARKSTTPKIEWIREIAEAADKAEVPVFLKDNLRSILPEEVPLFNKNQYELRQEFPK